MEHTSTDSPVELHSSLVLAQKKEKNHRTNCHATATLFDLHTAGKRQLKLWKELEKRLEKKLCWEGRKEAAQDCSFFLLM